MPKRGRPSAWAIAKAAASMRTPYSKGGRGWGNKRARFATKVVPGFTRVGGPYKRALLGRAQTLGGTIEKKYLDSVFTATTATTAGYMIAATLLTIPQGTTEVTRVGGKINITNVNIRGVLEGPVGLANVPDQVRVILFWDKQCNGAQPVVTDLLKTANYLSYLNMDNVERFQIIKDKLYMVDVVGWDGTNALYKQLPLKVNYKCNVPIHYSSTTGAVAEIKSNNLGILFISQLGKASFAFNCRVKFTDA